VRLGVKGFEKTEFADELVDAVEPWRSGLDEFVEKSVWTRLKPRRFDITIEESN